ncbi:hypothetical protein ABK040_016770 [Willaertia magna]
MRQFRKLNSLSKIKKVLFVNTNNGVAIRSFSTNMIIREEEKRRTEFDGGVVEKREHLTLEDEGNISSRIETKLNQYKYLAEDVLVDPEQEQILKTAQEEANKRTYRREYDIMWEEEREPEYFKTTVQGKKIADIPCIFDFVPFLNDKVSPVIEKAELEELLQKPSDVFNYLVVDVRSSFRALDYVIPKAINIPFTEIKEGAFALKSSVFNARYNVAYPSIYTNIICYSDNPAESEAACLVLKEMGYLNTINYRGGCRDWFGNEFKVLWKKKKVHRVNAERIRKLSENREKVKEKLNEMASA